MKKLLIFSLAYYPHHVSGAEAAVKEITDRVADIEFHMVTLRFGAEPEREVIGNVIVHRVGFGGAYISKILFPLIAALAAKRLDGEHHFDAMWAMMTYMLLPTMLAHIFGVRAPHIVTLQDGDPYEKVFGRARIIPFLPLIDQGFRRAAVVQVISKYLAEWPRKRGSDAPTIVIHNGANPRDISGDIFVAEVESLKKELGKSTDEIYLVNTARLEPQKGNDITIRALPFLPNNVKLLLVGDGSEDRMLKELASELGVKDRVIFTGHVDRAQVTLYRKASDIFVCPSRSEGLGNAFLSAMASRLPVVATQEGGLSVFIFGKNDTDSQTAWVVTKDSPAEIADAVKEILAHPEIVADVSNRARAMVLRDYNWDTIATQMRDRVFGKVLFGNSDPHLIERAKKIAEKAHEGQVRKTDTSAYIEHPRAVAKILADAGFPDAVVAAAWVHDVVEDANVTIQDLRRDLGEEVASIVMAVTEDKTLPWEERKRRYIESVRNGPAGGKVVSIADKIHNLQSLLAAHNAQGADVWNKFSRGKEKQLWFGEEMLKMFNGTLEHPLVEEYQTLIEKMRELA